MYIAGGNVNWFSHYGKHYGGSSKLKELLYDPPTPLLGVYPEKMRTLICKDTGTPMFIPALFNNSQYMEATQVLINRQVD